MNRPCVFATSITIHPLVPIRMSCTALIFLTRSTFQELCIGLLPYLCTAQKHNGVVSIYLRISFRLNLELEPVSLMFLQQEKLHVRVPLGGSLATLAYIFSSSFPHW